MSHTTDFTVVLIAFLASLSICARGQDSTDINLYQLSLQELTRIQVTSVTKKEQKLSEAPGIIMVVSQNEIRLKNYQSLAEVLESIPGFYITTNHVTYNTSIRGINGGRDASSRIIKVMIDGQVISFRSSSENFIGPELIPMGMIERIEIIRGPMSALYGANAFLGVVNIITKNGAELKENTSFKFGSGNLLRANYQFTTGYSNAKFDFTFGLEGSEIDRSGLVLPHSTDVLKIRINSEFGDAHPFYVPTAQDMSKPITMYATFGVGNKKNTFKTTGYYQELDNGGRFLDKNPVLNQTRININNWFVKESFHGAYLKDQLDINVSVAYSGGQTLKDDLLDFHPKPDEGIKIARNFGFSGWDMVGEVQYAPVKKFNMLIGGDTKNDKYELLSYTTIDKNTGDSGNVVQTLGEERFDNFGVYGRFLWEVINKGLLTGGIRYDNHNIYKGNINYNLGAVYSFTDNWYAKILYGTSFNPPSPNQLFSPSPPYNPDEGVVGNSALIPEQARTYEISSGLIIAEGISIEANGYYNLVDSIIIIEQFGGITSPRNKDDINTLGYDIDLLWQFKQFSGRANISYQNSLVEDRDGNKEFVSLFPEYMVGAELSYDFSKLNVNLVAKYIDEVEASQNNIQNNLIFGKVTSYYLPSYFLLNLNMSSRNLYLGSLNEKGKKNETVIALSIRNLLDTEYILPGFYKYDVPGLGRSIVFSVQQYF